MSALTEKQAELLEFIQWFQRTKGKSPSFDEMREGLCLQSKSGVHRLVCALEERGYIRRLAHRSRAIEINADPHLPDTAVLSAISSAALAREARRRGLVLGEYHREKVRVGRITRDRRRFIEVAA